MTEEEKKRLIEKLTEKYMDEDWDTRETAELKAALMVDFFGVEAEEYQNKNEST